MNQQKVSLRREEDRNQTANLRKPEDRSSIVKRKGWPVISGYSVKSFALITRLRTHRERKEQYIKSLEIELSRLREGYTSDVASMNNSLEQHRIALREHQEENAFLKDVLASRGISFQAELEKRDATKSRNPSFASSTTLQQPGLYSSMTSEPSSTSGYSPQPTLPDRSYGAGRMGSMSGGSASGGTQHSYSSPDPGVFEQAIKHESPGVPEMPGIFERDPQLQVEFILA